MKIMKSDGFENWIYEYIIQCLKISKKPLESDNLNDYLFRFVLDYIEKYYNKFSNIDPKPQSVLELMDFLVHTLYEPKSLLDIVSKTAADIVFLPERFNREHIQFTLKRHIPSTNTYNKKRRLDQERDNALENERERELELERQREREQELAFEKQRAQTLFGGDESGAVGSVSKGTADEEDHTDHTVMINAAKKLKEEGKLSDNDYYHFINQIGANTKTQFKFDTFTLSKVISVLSESTQNPRALNESAFQYFQKTVIQHYEKMFGKCTELWRLCKCGAISESRTCSCSDAIVEEYICQENIHLIDKKLATSEYIKSQAKSRILADWFENQLCYGPSPPEATPDGIVFLPIGYYLILAKSQSHIRYKDFSRCKCRQLFENPSYDPSSISLTVTEKNWLISVDDTYWIEAIENYFIKNGHPPLPPFCL